MCTLKNKSSWQIPGELRGIKPQVHEVVLKPLNWTEGIHFWFPGARFDDGAGGDNEVQRTMLELINQLDGFDPRGNIKVLMATNRPDTLDPALMRPGRLDRKIEFGLPDLEVRISFMLSFFLLFFFT